MTEATLTSKGQITVPKVIRERLHLKPGDKVEFLVDAEGHVTIVPVTEDVTSLKGLVPKPAKPVSIEEMNAAIRRRGAGD